MEGFPGLPSFPETRTNVKSVNPDGSAAGGGGGGGFLGQIGAIVGTIFGTNVKRGRLSAGARQARELAALIHDGALDGLSISFRTARAHADKAAGVRRILEADLLVELEELEDVPAGTTAKAVKEAALRVHLKRGRLLAVKGTQSLVVFPGALQRDVLLDDLHDVRLQAEVVDEALWKKAH